jgi:hypothetical protein
MQGEASTTNRTYGDAIIAPCAWERLQRSILFLVFVKKV